MQNKRGISAIVATVLIILITVAGVTIVWAAIIPMIKTNLELGTACLDADVLIDAGSGYTCYDAEKKIVAVQVKKGANEMNIPKIEFLLGLNGTSRKITTSFNLGSNVGKVFYIPVAVDVESVSVAPVVKIANKEKSCDVGAKVKLKRRSLNADLIELISNNSSCLNLYNQGHIDDGVYLIDPDGVGGEDSFEVYCDMTTDGGGWTLIASYVDGSFFNDCTDIGMSYGTSCSTNCGEFADTSNPDKHCDDANEKAIQDSEMEKLKNKYVIEHAFGEISEYQIKDFVSPSYYTLSFGEAMFSNNQNEFITYDFSPYTTTNMKDFYTNENTNHLELRISALNSNLDASINPCNTLELAIMMADNDGGTVNYPPRRYYAWSDARAGPGWDSNNNGGCHYDDLSAQWLNKKLGSQNNQQSAYILWFVR